MPRERTQLPLNAVLPAVLKERSMSQRELARQLHVSQGWLSLALVGKRPLSRDMIKEIAGLLGVAPDYFVEFRRAVVMQAVADRPELVDQLYDQLQSPTHRRTRPTDSDVRPH